MMRFFAGLLTGALVVFVGLAYRHSYRLARQYDQLGKRVERQVRALRHATQDSR